MATAASHSPLTAGSRLRRLRENLGFTIRDVEAASHRVANHLGKADYCIPLSRLSDIESKNVLPGIHKLCSLAVIYRRRLEELLALYDIDVPGIATELQQQLPWPQTRRIDPDIPRTVGVPIMDPGFDTRRTAETLRFIQRWGAFPAAQLKRLADENHFTYAMIGSDDRMMYPLLRPGALVQIDCSVNELTSRGWTSDYERPIYFIETRGGSFCCWAAMSGGNRIILQPHSMSPAAPVVLRYPEEAEIVGRVVGIAMRLEDPAPSPTPAKSQESPENGRPPHD
jgi:transcriptional regulator with XRE-family HTH domain